MATEYLDRLLKVFEPDNAAHRGKILNGAAAWFLYHDDFSACKKRKTKGKGPDKELDIVAYYAAFCEGRHEVIQPFAKWALNILKNFFPIPDLNTVSQF